MKNYAVEVDGLSFYLCMSFEKAFTLSKRFIFLDIS